MTSNYIIATWSGKRRNPSNDYLKAQIRQLERLEHSIDQVTIVKPEGSDDPDYYPTDEEIVAMQERASWQYVHMWRPINDRAYGQFLYAFQLDDDFDYYFLVEDDYLPNIDNFDTRLIELMKEKGCDYLCGSFGPVPGGTVDIPRHNVGVMTGPALKRLMKFNPKPTFYPNGENDGQEQEMFGQMCKNAGLVIKDYSQDYPVPYFDRYLRYFSEKRGERTLFVPYQLLHHKAFGYHGEEGDANSHFLSTMEFKWDDPYRCTVFDGELIVGRFRMEQGETVQVLIDATYRDYNHLIKNRIIYECRGRSVTFTYA